LGTLTTGTSLRFVPYYKQGFFSFVVGHVSARPLFANARNGHFASLVPYYKQGLSCS